MYLLDTNILSELAKPSPHPLVLQRIERYQDIEAMSAITWHELSYGVARLPEGTRKEQLMRFIMEVLAPHIPVIPYDEHAAWVHGTLRARLEKEGITVPFADSQIAATALANNMILVTRNEGDFLVFKDLYKENWFNP
jgi:tRNA(fMet)-specific endonuclease VapC